MQTYRHGINVLLGFSDWNVSLTVSENVLPYCHGDRTTGCRGWVLWVLRRFYVDELLLTKEKFYRGGETILHEDRYRSSGNGSCSWGPGCVPTAWIPKEYQREAHCVLQLLVISYQLLTLNEVAEVVAVDCKNEIFDPEDGLRDRHDILDICSSLIFLSG